MKINGSIAYGGLLLSVVIAALCNASPDFENVDVRGQEPDNTATAWYKRDLNININSVPGLSSPTASPSATASSSSAASTSSSTTPVTPTGTVGAHHACHRNSQCQSGFCNQGHCQSPRKLGSACSQNAACASDSCVFNKCVPKSHTGSSGQYCNLSAQCASGTFCFNARCTPKYKTGNLCYKGIECQTGLCVGLKCIEARTVQQGGTCKHSTDCKGSNSFCRRGKCAIKAVKGAACYKNNGCISNRCIHRVCQA